MDTATLRLTVIVEYELNGTPVEQLKVNLIAAAEYMAGIGKFTQDTEAEVTMWTETVDTLNL